VMTYAAGYGTPDIVEMLVKAGADATVKDNKGLTAIDHATKQGNTAFLEALGQ